MTEPENEASQQLKFAQANPSPVLSSDANGVLQFINSAALTLKDDLELERIEDLLPTDHAGLVTACLKTGMTLTENFHLGDRSIVWSYKSTDKSDVVYIYGYDVTDYQHKTSSSVSLPEENPNPVLIYKKNGTIQFSNVAVTTLLNKFELENIEDALPVNHKELMNTCFKTGLPVTEERQTSDWSIVWAYRLPDASEDIYIYGYDVTSHKSSVVSAKGLLEVNPSPVLTIGSDGVLRYFNYAATQLLMELGLDNVEDILPPDHRGLVKACYSTNTPLSEQYQMGGRTLAWSYMPVDDSDVIYIYGYDISDYCSNTPDEEV